MAEEFSGFYKLPIDERLSRVKKSAGLTDAEAALLAKEGGLPLETANRMVENLVGTIPMPLGVAVNFKINGNGRLIPMATEEPSVIAACSYAAKLALPEGFVASADEPVMIGQIQLVQVPDCEGAAKKIIAKKAQLIKGANSPDAPLVRHGGGVRDLDAKVLGTPRGKMLIVYIYVDTRDAMGANAVNTFAESMAPTLEEISGGKVRLRILSNLAAKRMARAKAVWKKEAIGADVVEGILDAYEFAVADQYRATTNNKGIMNGIDALMVATGNDWRAIEAGAHSYAAISGKYLPLAKYSKDKNGDLVGEIELPMAVGTIGGATKTHPVAQIALKILGNPNAKELAQIAASVGLAQNFAAIRALATEGIQRGHMELHSRNIAVLAGATGAEIDRVAELMAGEGKVSVQRATELLKK
ncbi:MAG: hydroxymethylglutaryl-CoA reductase, degradative [Candidatus Micrarchaeia archaeon]|jgi:hydroxymethylglutaryl-CoA reductase